MKIVTCATHDHPILKFTSDRLPIEILWTKPPWSMIMKIDLVRNFCKNILNTKEIILYIDAYDVIPSANCTYSKLEDFILKYFNLNKVTFNAEMNCWPYHLINEYKNLDKIKYKWKFLNAGIFVGTAERILEIFDISDNFERGWCDQELLSKVYLQRPDLISLDYQCMVFQSLFDGIGWSEINWKDYEISNIGIRNIVCDTYPLLFHGNGGIQLHSLINYITNMESNQLFNSIFFNK